MRWNQGRATIDKLIADGELQRVPPNREHADQLFAQARKDLASAELLRSSNPKRAYESLYDTSDLSEAEAIVKACESVLDQMSPF
jgi:hypothetical protein